MGADPEIIPSAPAGRIHIVHVVTSLEPGGLENGVVNLANRLDPSRFRTSVICLERIGEFRARLKSGVEVVCLEKRPGFRWKTGIQLGEVLEAFGADIVHTHNLGPLIYGVIALRMGRGCGLIVHGEHAELRDDEKTCRRRWMRRAGYRFCEAVHAVSSALRDELIDFGLAGEKIRVIFNGVDCERFSPVDFETETAAQPDCGLPDSAFVIGMSGRFGALKRHDRLIAAFESLAGRFPNVHLLLVGDYGPEKERVLALREASVFRDRIVWAGFQIDPAPWYRVMDLLVIPSENEGLSNVMLEAMASEVPCLAHPACGAAEVIHDGKNGFLRTMGNAESLADELEEILENRVAVDDLGKAARKTALDRFSIEAMIEGYSSLYVGVCSGKPSGA